ncbi:MAG: nuclear transport factor 2 family protein [Ilumatobacteraceae bacterium]
MISRYADAWRRGDIVEMIDCYHWDVTVHYGGTSSYAGIHHGRDRLVHLLIETAQRSNRQLVSIDQIDDHDTHGALFVTETMTVDHTTTQVARALRYHVADDRIGECWLYDHDQHLVDRAWSNPLPDTPTG